MGDYRKRRGGAGAAVSAERIETQLEILDWLQKKQRRQDHRSGRMAGDRREKRPRVAAGVRVTGRDQAAASREAGQGRAEAEERRRKKREAAEEAAFQKAADEHIDRLEPEALTALEAEGSPPPIPRRGRRSTTRRWPAIARRSSAILRDHLRPPPPEAP